MTCKHGRPTFSMSIGGCSRDTLSHLLFLLVILVALHALSSGCRNYGFRTSSDNSEPTLSCREMGSRGLPSSGWDAWVTASRLPRAIINTCSGIAMYASHVVWIHKTTTCQIPHSWTRPPPHCNHIRRLCDPWISLPVWFLYSLPPTAHGLARQRSTNPSPPMAPPRENFWNAHAEGSVVRALPGPGLKNYMQWRFVFRKCRFAVTPKKKAQARPPVVTEPYTVQARHFTYATDFYWGCAAGGKK